jgi:hypothetical protein
MAKPDPTNAVRRDIKAAVRRLDDLRKQDHQAIRSDVKREIKSLRRRLKSETKRINAIRKVDVEAVAVANTAAENRANTLARQVTDAKDAQQVALKAETDPIRSSIDALRQSQWTIAGGTDNRQISHQSWGVWAGIIAAIVFGASTLLLMTITIAVTIYLGLRK